VLQYTRAERAQLVAGGVSLAVYALVAWLGARLLDASFWRVLGALMAARAFFGIVEGIAGILNWRLFGRRKTVEGFLTVLQTNNFPPRFYQHDDFLNYLARIESNTCPESLKRTAKEFEKMLEFAESQGILAGARMHAATEVALEMYSPKARAPHL